jgi:uncharacterized phage protein gp47/JayE
MAFETWTLEQIRSFVLARKALEDPLLDTSENGDAWVDANAVAHVAVAMQASILESQAQMFPGTATGSFLDEHLRMWCEDGRRVATAWEGTIRFESLSGTPTIQTGTVVLHADGTEYETTADVTALSWSGSYATATATANTLGTIGNKEVSTVLTVSSPPADVSPTCWLWTTTTEGTDAESDEDGQARCLATTRYRPGGGNWADYLLWAMDIDGVESAFVYPAWDDEDITPVRGTVTVIPRGPEGKRVVAAATRASVQTHLDEVAPVGVTVTVEHPATSDVTVTVYVRPKTGFEPDWTGSIGVTSCVSPFTHVDLDASPVGTVAAGDRVVCFVGVGLEAEERVVSALGANYVEVTEPFSTTIAGTTTMYPGGPLWAPVKAAIEDVFDDLGTSTSNDVTRPRFPRVESELPSTVFTSRIVAAICAVEGVNSCRLMAPAADTTNKKTPGDPIVLKTLDPNLSILWE